MAISVSSAQSPTAGESGIEGTITIGPANAGPTRPDVPNSVPLANAAFSVENENGAVKSFTTDAHGRFRVSLPPGHYKISMTGKKTGIGRFGPFEADVVEGKMTNVSWDCDSGIR